MTVQERAEDQFNQHPKLQVLFFFDPDEAFRKAIDTWDHDEIACLVADNTPFRLKYRLEHDFSDQPVLLYVPERRPVDWDQYPLADLLAANRELRIDRVAEFMDQFQLDVQHRGLIQRYFRGELEYKNRQRFLGTILKGEILSERKLQRGLAAYHLDVGFRSVPTEEQLLAGVFLQATDAGDFEAYRKTCETLELDGFLGRLLAGQFELERTDFSLKNVRTAAQTMKYNLLMQPVTDERADDPYRKLRMSSTINLNRIGSLANAWRESRALDRSPEDVLDMLAPEVDETKLLDIYGPETKFGYMTTHLRSQRIEQALGQAENQPSQAKEAVTDIRTGETLEAAAADVIWHMASFYQILVGYKSLDLGTVDAFVETYAEELYRCDQHYRQAIAAFRCLRRQDAGYAAELEAPYERFLHHYHDQFVHPLNTAWQQAFEEQVDRREQAQLGRQGAFYSDYIARDDQKTAVIISDALRYEVAQELTDRLLQADARKVPTLQPMLVALPSVTSVGMAHLLPHQNIKATEKGFSIDGISTSGTRNRERILQATHPDACALPFDELQEYDKQDGRDLFKEHPLVYIYHDRIDAAGDDRKTEAETIPAAEKTVGELQRLIRTLNNWNVYRVIVTTDHGFLYAENKLPDSMKESFPEVEGRFMRRNRCIVARKSKEDGGYRFPLRAVSDIDADLEVCVPRAVNRYRLQGAGKQFAHGGASLQEMIIPALEVRKVREDKAEKVSLRLLSQDRVIRSGALSVKILQANAVSSSHQARAVDIGLYDDQDALVSEEKELVLDSTSTDPTERSQDVILSLGSAANQLNFCHLKVFDKADHNRLNPLVSQRYSIQRLIEQDEF